MDNSQNTTGPVDVTKHSRFQDFKKKLQTTFKNQDKKRLAIIGGISLAVLIAGSVMAFTLIKDDSVVTPAVIPEPAPPEPEEKFYSPLTGVEVSKELSERPVTAVMIENSIDARPQAGLEEAGIVFEAIAEGGITRFMAVYQEAQPGKIGPIRSARPYYVQWAKGLDAAYTHSGGSGPALALIQTLGVKDLDHGKSSGYFDRVSNRFAPHNVYTDMGRLDQFKNDKGYTTSEFTPFARVEIEEETEVEVTEASGESATSEEATPAATNPKANSISFDISSSNYNTSYTYDAAAKLYRRVMAGLPHKDEVSGKQISPSVVIALYTDYGIAANNIHSVYRTTGTGQAEVFQNGEVIKATWRKTSESAPLEILKANGKDPLPLNRGQTWITAIQQGRVSHSP